MVMRWPVIALAVVGAILLWMVLIPDPLDMSGHQALSREGGAGVTPNLSDEKHHRLGAGEFDDTSVAVLPNSDGNGAALTRNIIDADTFQRRALENPDDPSTWLEKGDPEEVNHTDPGMDPDDPSTWVRDDQVEQVNHSDPGMDPDDPSTWLRDGQMEEVNHSDPGMAPDDPRTWPRRGD